MPCSALRTLPLALLLLAACGSPPPAETPADAPAADTPAGGDEAAKPEPAGDTAAPAEGAAGSTPAPAEQAAPASQSEPEILARDFLKTGGRRIGYSATKKGFAYPLEQRREDGFRLDILFTDEEGRKRDALEVCDYAECVEKLDEITKEMIPKLASRLESDGYVAIRGLGWPSGREEFEVGTLAMKLRYTGGRLEALREGKPAATLGRLTKSPEILAIFPVPEAKRLAILAKPAGDAKGVVQELHVVKLPQ